MLKYMRIATGLCVFTLFQMNAACAAMTHAAADHGIQGLIIESVSLIIVLGVLVYTVKCFLWPGERDDRHIKRRILHDHW